MSCLFQSLSELEGRGDATSLRREICAFLALGGLESAAYGGDELLFEMPLSAYVAKMQQAAEWGGAPEIRAFCEMRRATVVVRCAQREITFVPTLHPPAPELVYRLTWTGNHYTPYRG
jgi:hypothetical protein